MGEVVDQPKEGGRNAEGNTNQHRGPGAAIVGLENGEDNEQQCCKCTAQHESAATVVVYGGLRIPVK